MSAWRLLSRPVAELRSLECMATVYLSASDVDPVGIRALLRDVARRLGKRYAQAVDVNGRVVAIVEVW